MKCTRAMEGVHISLCTASFHENCDTFWLLG